MTAPNGNKNQKELLQYIATKHAYVVTITTPKHCGESSVSFDSVLIKV